jgi:hypothetical protein
MHMGGFWGIRRVVGMGCLCFLFSFFGGRWCYGSLGG